MDLSRMLFVFFCVFAQISYSQQPPSTHNSSPSKIPSFLSREYPSATAGEHKPGGPNPSRPGVRGRHGSKEIVPQSIFDEAVADKQLRLYESMNPKNVLRSTIRERIQRSKASFPAGVSASTIKPTWVANYASGSFPSIDGAIAIRIDSRDGSIVLFGGTTESFTGPGYLTMKLSPQGDTLWTARYGESGGESVPTAAALDAEGNIYVTGRIDHDFVTIKYSRLGEQVWLARYDGPGHDDDFPRSIAVDSMQNVYVAGTSYSETGGPDYTTIKYDRDGVLQWSAGYNYSYDYAVAVAVDKRGYVYVTGSSISVETRYDFATIKYSSQGVRQWVARYAGPLEDEAVGLAIDDHGNVFVAGNSNIWMSAISDYVIVKYDSEGVQKWVDIYDDPEGDVDICHAVALDTVGNVYVTGQSITSFGTIKYNGNGGRLWIARYEGPNHADAGLAIDVDNSGNVYVAGISYGQGSAVVKYDSLGNQMFDAPYWGEALALRHDQGGNVIVTGHTSDDETLNDVYTIAFDADGHVQWSNRYNGPGTSGDHARAMAVDAHGNIYVTGESNTSATEWDFATVKYNVMGEQVWDARYNGPSNWVDIPCGIVVDMNENVYVTGESYGPDPQYATVKYNRDGIQLWDARHGQYSSFPTAMVLNTSGEVCVTGLSSDTLGNYHYETVKYDSNGEERWIAHYDPSLWSPSATSLAVGPDNCVYITGTAGTIKYNGDGVEQWVAGFSGLGEGGVTPTSIALDNSGNVIVGGFIGGWPNYDYITVKYTTDGVQRWFRRYNGTGNNEDEIVCVAVDSIGNIVVSGMTVGAGPGAEITTIRYDPDGNQQWIASYDADGNGADNVTGLTFDDSSNAYVSGTCLGSGTWLDYATIKYSPEGHQLWVGKYNGPANRADEAAAVVVDKRYNVYVTGGSRVAGGEVFTTMKYAQKDLRFSARAITFSSTQVSCRSSSAIQLTAVGMGAVGIDKISSDDSDFTAVLSSSSINPGKAEQCEIIFSPLSGGPKSGHLIFQHDGDSSPDTIDVAGVGAGSGSEAVVRVDVGSGWQLSALPVEAACVYGARVFEFDKIYHYRDTMLNGCGYWRRLDVPKIWYAGLPIVRDTVEVHQRWNIVGSISLPVPVSAIRTVPNGIIQTPFYGYNGAYFIADTVQPGHAYWIKTTQEGELILDPSAPPLLASSKIELSGELPPPPPDGDVLTPETPIGEEATPKPGSYSLSQNYPNPFNPTTLIRYELPENADVTLKVFSVLGQEVKTLVLGRQAAGYQAVTFDGTELPSGIYFYQIRAGYYTAAKKMLLVR